MKGGPPWAIESASRTGSLARAGGGPSNKVLFKSWGSGFPRQTPLHAVNEERGSGVRSRAMGLRQCGVVLALAGKCCSMPSTRSVAAECGSVPRGRSGAGWFLPLRVCSAPCCQRGAWQRSAAFSEGAMVMQSSARSILDWVLLCSAFVRGLALSLVLCR